VKYNMTKIIYKTIFLAILLVFLVPVTNALAQATGPCDPIDPEPDCENWDADNAVPIDGGASILIAAGVAYGLKRAYDKRKQNKEETDKV